MKRNNRVLVDEEVKLGENDFIVSKTDARGIITYCNEIFMHMSGYSEKELLGTNHNLIRHPDMPRAAFKLCWDLIQSGKEFFGFVKNLRKDGQYYWVFANITPDYDANGKIVGYTSIRRKPSQAAIDTLIPIYEQLVQIENQKDMHASEKFLFDFLEQNDVSYDNLVLSLQGE